MKTWYLGVAFLAVMLAVLAPTRLVSATNFPFATSVASSDWTTAGDEISNTGNAVATRTAIRTKTRTATRTATRRATATPTGTATPTSSPSPTTTTTASPTTTATSQPAADWPMAGHDLSGNRYQPNETVLNPSNVSTLTQHWAFHAGGVVSANPTIYDGAVYFPDWRGNVYKLDATNGGVIWTHQMSEYNGYPGSLSRTTPTVYSTTLILGDLYRSGQITSFGAHVMSISQDSGALNWITKVDTSPFSQIPQSPLVYGDTVYVGISSWEEDAGSVISGYVCCTFQGTVVALNAATGQLLWKTTMVPTGYSGGAVWSGMAAIDPTRQSLYLGTGNNYSTPASVGTCLEANPNSATCTASDDYFDSVLSLDLGTGVVKWAHRFEKFDASPNPPCTDVCPSLDLDFGSGANLFTATVTGTVQSLVGIGQKSGMYYALNADTGAAVWSKLVGPGSAAGGVMWGTATDGQRIYVSDANGLKKPYRLISGQVVTGGAWSALDPATGTILWQTADPVQSTDPGPPTVANGVVYVGSADPRGDIYALDAATGTILWSFSTGQKVDSGATVANGLVYWGSGYPPTTSAAGLDFFAFGLP